MLLEYVSNRRPRQLLLVRVDELLLVLDRRPDDDAPDPLKQRLLTRGLTENELYDGPNRSDEEKKKTTANERNGIAREKSCANSQSGVHECEPDFDRGVWNQVVEPSECAGQDCRRGTTRHWPKRTL